MLTDLAGLVFITVGYWVVSLPVGLVVGLVATGVAGWPPAREPRLSASRLLLPSAAIPLMWLWTAVASPPHAGPPGVLTRPMPWQAYVVIAVFVAEIGVAIALARRSPGARRRLAAAGLVQLWLGLVAAWVCATAMTCPACLGAL